MTEPEHRIPNEPTGAGAYLAAGDAFAEQGRWSEAQASFEMAMKLAPKASLTWLSYALACFPQHRFGPAGTAIEDALHYAIPILDTPEIRQGIEAYEREKWADAQRCLKRRWPMALPTRRRTSCWRFRCSARESRTTLSATFSSPRTWKRPGPGKPELRGASLRRREWLLTDS